MRHLAHHAEIAPALGHELSGAEEPRVFARDADRARARLVQQRHELGIDAPREHHLDELHVVAPSDAHAVDEFGDVPERFHRLRDLRAAAVDDNRMQPQKL